MEEMTVEEFRRRMGITDMVDPGAVEMTLEEYWRRIERGPKPLTEAEQITAEEYRQQAVSEHEAQAAVIAWANLYEEQYPALKLLHANPNGGHRHVVVGMRMKREGVKRGVPDLHLPWPAQGYHGLWIEMKVGKNTLTDEQKWWLEQLNEAGHLAVVRWGMEAAKEEIVKYLEMRV